MKKIEVGRNRTQVFSVMALLSFLGITNPPFPFASDATTSATPIAQGRESTRWSWLNPGDQVLPSGSLEA